MTQLPIFVINLPNASNRRELINQQFYKYDKKYNVLGTYGPISTYNRVAILPEQ